ncbi:hypothetical protein ACQ86N_40245 [Puia sp. P3]|uniref:hypothetical protein n=1 Tax=Puia sp. P3 TaxID=3423952 RepID=UPI003D671A1A
MSREKPFDWIRGYQVGGKSIMWARQTQRWSDFDFEGPARDGFAVDWPIRYKDLAPWYSYVEKFVGISGNRDGLPNLPDGEFLPALDLTCVENYFKETVAKKYKDRHVIYGRCATSRNQRHCTCSRAGGSVRRGHCASAAVRSGATTIPIPPPSPGPNARVI